MDAMVVWGTTLTFLTTVFGLTTLTYSQYTHRDGTNKVSKLERVVTPAPGAQVRTYTLNPM